MRHHHGRSVSEWRGKEPNRWIKGRSGGRARREQRGDLCRPPMASPESGRMLAFASLQGFIWGMSAQRRRYMERLPVNGGELEFVTKGTGAAPLLIHGRLTG